MAFAPIGVTTTTSVQPSRSNSLVRDTRTDAACDQVSVQGGGSGASDRVSALSAGFDDNYGDAPPTEDDGHSAPSPPDDRSGPTRGRDQAGEPGQSTGKPEVDRSGQKDAPSGGAEQAQNQDSAHPAQ